MVGTSDQPMIRGDATKRATLQGGPSIETGPETPDELRDWEEVI